MKVELTQYLMPNGRQIPVTTNLPDELSVQYEKLLGCGARLTAEVLTTGEVSLCVSGPDGDDFDLQVVPNGPEVPIALGKLVGNFSTLAYESWLQDMAIDD